MAREAALTSAATFAVGAALPILSILLAPAGAVILTVAIAAVVETVDGSLVERLEFDRFTGQFARTGK